VGAGTIQCLPGGTVVVLMADSQTIGGYPRIAQVAAADLPLCAQVRTHEPVFFKAISLADAEALLLNKEGWFRRTAYSLQREIRGV
jgi:antagonist of KipI